MLKVENLRKTYETGNNSYLVLKDLSFQVKKGEFVAVMGPSGSGKTTLLNCISCFIPHDQGKILLNGKDLSGLGQEELAKVRNQQLGFVFQDFMLLDGLTVFENICLPQVIAGKPVKPMEEKAHKYCRAFGIEKIQDKYPAEISGGEKQRTAVARAMINSPFILLADEPTGNLDSRSCKAVIDAFLQAKEQLGATVFMVTHDSYAASFCDRVIVLRDGVVHTELTRSGGRREFMDQLLDVLRELGAMFFKELALLTAVSALLGILGAMPVSWLIWKFFESFLVSTKEMAYRFGAWGFLLGLVFALILAILLGAAGRRFVKRTNVMDILRTQHQPEMVKKIPGWTFGAGILLILAGIILAMGLPRVFVYVLHIGPPSLLNLFYILSVAGIYLVLLGIVGQSRKGKNRKKYYKNLVSVSLMRFSARSTTRNMCVVVLLLFAGIFAFYFGMMYMNSYGPSDSPTTRDFVLHFPVQEDQMDQEEIQGLAGEHSVELQDYEEGEGANLVITYKATDYTENNEYVTVTREKEETALFFSGETYEKLTGEDPQVEPGSYKTITQEDYQDNIWDFKDGLSEASNPDTGAELPLTYGGTLEYNSLANMTAPFVYVVSGQDYQTLIQGLGQEWQEKVILFDVTDPDVSYPFAKALYEEYVNRATSLSAHPTLYDPWKERQVKADGEAYSYGEVLDLDPENTQLLGEWRYAPQFQILNSQDRLQFVSVYVMLCLYIFIITLSTVAIMTYVRGVSVATDNREVFVSLERLGADREYRKRILNAQLRKIFTYPGILGCMVGLFVSIGMSYMNDGRFTALEFQSLSIVLGISVVILLFLGAVYLAARRKGEKILGISGKKGR